MATPSAANGRIAKLLLKRTTSNTAVAPGPFHIFPPLKKKCKEATHPKQTSALLCTGGATFKKKIEETLLILKQKAA